MVNVHYLLVVINFREHPLSACLASSVFSNIPLTCPSLIPLHVDIKVVLEDENVSQDVLLQLAPLVDTDFLKFEDKPATLSLVLTCLLSFVEPVDFLDIW